MLRLVLASCLLAVVAGRMGESVLSGLIHGDGEAKATEKVVKVFRLSSYKLSWDDAENACVTKKMHLATIRNQKENNRLRTLMDRHGINTPAWIGATDRSENGTYQWSADGGALDYTAWGFGEPNDFGGDEDCICMINHGSQHGRWWDLACHNKLHFACESYVTV